MPWDDTHLFLSVVSWLAWLEASVDPSLPLRYLLSSPKFKDQPLPRVGSSHGARPRGKRSSQSTEHVPLGGAVCFDCSHSVGQSNLVVGDKERLHSVNPAKIGGNGRLIKKKK